MRNCKQIKCTHLWIGGCPRCPECGADPQKVCSDDRCVSCYACEGDEGWIRGKPEKENESTNKTEQVIKQ